MRALAVYVFIGVTLALVYFANAGAIRPGGGGGIRKDGNGAICSNVGEWTCATSADCNGINAGYCDGGYCDCDAGFTGRQCANVCDTISCNEPVGSCTFPTGTCTCDAGYAPAAANGCNVEGCDGGVDTANMCGEPLRGSCITTATGGTCACDAGFNDSWNCGDECDTLDCNEVINAADGGGGTCVLDGGFKDCNCAPQWSGDNCETFTADPCTATQPPNPGNLYLWMAARCRNDGYSDTDDVTGITAEVGPDGTAVAGQYPTFQDPCFSGYLNDEPCYAWGGSPDKVSVTVADYNAPWTVCAIFVTHSTIDGTYGKYTHSDDGTVYYTRMQIFNSSDVAGSNSRHFTGDSSNWNPTYGTPSGNHETSNSTPHFRPSWTYAVCQWLDSSLDFYAQTSESSVTTAQAQQGTAANHPIRDVVLGAHGTGSANYYWDGEILEWAFYDTNIDFADWESYAESVYGTLPQDTAP